MTTDNNIKIALTGATGFIGQHLLDTLLSRGSYSNTDDSMSVSHVSALARLIPKQDTHDRLEWVQGNLEQAEVLKSLVKGADIVIHNAGVVRGRTQGDFHAVNAEGTERIARIAKEAGVKHFILISSLAAREPHLSHYASSKAAAEVRLKGVQGLNWSIVRPPAVYGPGDKELAPLFDSMRKGLGVHPGGADSQLSIIHVSDLVRCIRGLAAQLQEGSLKPGQTYEPDDGARGYRWEDIRQAAARAFERRVFMLSIPQFALRGAAKINHFTSGVFQYAPMLSPGKVNELTHPNWVCRPLPAAVNWKPQVDLETGLREFASSV